MFGRNRKSQKNTGTSKKFGRRHVVHTAECTAIHEAMLMSLYLGYGAPSAPLFIPTGSLVCTCDRDADAASNGEPPMTAATENFRVAQGILISA